MLQATRWASWCKQRDQDTLSGPASDIVNFLAELFKKGYQYQSLISHRSAISSVHERIDGFSVGQHPTITRALKGAYHSRPPLPRYSSFWDVGIMLSHLKQLGCNDDISLRQLTLKTAMLLALTRSSRSADLSSLDLQTRSYVSNGVDLSLFIYLSKVGLQDLLQISFSQPFKKTLPYVQ